MLNQFQYLIIDLKRWKCSGFKDLFYLIFEQGIWATIFYRMSRMLFLVNIPLLRIMLRLIAFFIYKFADIFLGVAIPAGTDIGPGLYIGHHGLIIINHEVIAGRNLSIGPGVLVGQKGGGHKGSPQLGNDVYIGVGAKVLGKIKIGNNVKIGANAVVVMDVPDNATAVGVPARIIEKT